MRLLEAVVVGARACLAQCAMVREAVAGALRSSGTLRTDFDGPMAAAAECMQAASDAAHARWVTLLSARCRAPILSLSSTDQALSELSRAGAITNGPTPAQQ